MSIVRPGLLVVTRYLCSFSPTFYIKKYHLYWRNNEERDWGCGMGNKDILPDDLPKILPPDGQENMFFKSGLRWARRCCILVRLLTHDNPTPPPPFPKPLPVGPPWGRQITHSPSPPPRPAGLKHQGPNQKKWYERRHYAMLEWRYPTLYLCAPGVASIHPTRPNKCERSDRGRPWRSLIGARGCLIWLRPAGAIAVALSESLVGKSQ